ncbi:MAG: glycosyltransferase [Syntrophobacteraceae bacterium]
MSYSSQRPVNANSDWRSFSPLPVQTSGDAPAHSAKKRVCIASFDLVGPIRNGGVGTAFTSLAEGLASAGHEVTLLYLMGQFCENRTLDYWIADYQKKRIRFVPMPDPSVKILGSWHSIKAYETYLWLKGQSFDVIHFSEWNGPGYFCLLAKHQGIAFTDSLLCVHTHGPILWHKFTNSEYLERYEDVEICFMEKESVRLADVLLSPSKYLLNWMIAEKWMLPERCYVQQYVMPRNVRRQAVKHDNSIHRIDEIVFFGRLEVRKGLVLFCDALDLLASWPQHFKVTFLGKPVTLEGKTSEDYIAKRANKWSWPVKVITDLDQNGAISYLEGKGRLAVMPSLADNLPNTVLECLGAGIPFITSTAGGIPEMILEEDVPRICFPLRSEALAEGLRKAVAQGIRPARTAVDFHANESAWVAWHQSMEIPRPDWKLAAFSSSQDQGPLVSVCIPHRNRHEMLQTALETIRAQDYTNYEVIVVDDGSDKPETLAYLAKLESDFAARSWKLLRQENRYPGAARNNAVRHASGEYIFFMDDDNHAKHNELSTFIRVARKTGAAILTCMPDVFTGDGPNTAETTRWLYLGPAASAGAFENRFGDTNSLIRRDVFDAIGGFHEEYGFGHEDWELFARAVLAGIHLEVIPEALYWYRQSREGVNNSTSLHANRMRNIRPYLEVLPDSLREMVLLAQGMKYAQERAPASAVTSSEERTNLKVLLVAGKVLADMGQRDAAMEVISLLMQQVKLISDLAFTLHGLLGAAVILIALEDKDRALLFLLNARKIAEETKNPEAARKAESLMMSLA